MGAMLNRKKFLSLAMLAAVAASLPAEARRDDQDGAREDMAAGKIKKLPEIEAKIVPRMRGTQYLGPEYDSTAQVYRLKFIKGNRVIFVDVDARTGGILSQR